MEPALASKWTRTVFHRQILCIPFFFWANFFFPQLVCREQVLMKCLGKESSEVEREIKEMKSKNGGFDREEDSHRSTTHFWTLEWETREVMLFSPPMAKEKTFQARERGKWEEMDLFRVSLRVEFRCLTLPFVSFLSWFALKGMLRKCSITFSRFLSPSDNHIISILTFLSCLSFSFLCCVKVWTCKVRTKWWWQCKCYTLKPRSHLRAFDTTFYLLFLLPFRLPSTRYLLTSFFKNDSTIFILKFHAVD